MTELLIFLVTLTLLRFYIPLAKRIGVGQLIKKEGPDLHGYKEGTPTMGGVVFIPVSLAVLLFSGGNPLVVLSTFLFFLIGLLDDLSSLLKRDAYGMSAKVKFALQVVAGAVSVLSFPAGHSSLELWGRHWEIGAFYPFFAVFLLVGVSNAVNLTDGLDGLAGWIFVISALSMYTLTKDVSLLVITSALLAFLIYNSKPASVFMGDSGSLALGAFLASFSIVKGLELYLIFFGFVYLVETLSVMVQVLSFKLTGKRVFKMAPIHHHFELLGWREEKIVFVFGAINLLASLVALNLL